MPPNPKRLAITDIDHPEEPTVVPSEKDAEEVPDDDDDDDEAVEAKLATMRKHLETAHKADYTKAAVGKKMKRPAAPVIKRPAAPVIKRPAMAPGKPKQPPLKSRFAAIRYNGCGIYWGGDRRYRVLTTPNTATKNFSYQDDAGAADCWYDVIACCDDHACA